MYFLRTSECSRIMSQKQQIKRSISVTQIFNRICVCPRTVTVRLHNRAEASAVSLFDFLYLSLFIHIHWKSHYSLKNKCLCREQGNVNLIRIHFERDQWMERPVLGCQTFSVPPRLSVPTLCCARFAARHPTKDVAWAFIAYHDLMQLILFHLYNPKNLKLPLCCTLKQMGWLPKNER